MSKIVPLSDEKETQALKEMILKAREARVLDGRPSRIYDIGHEGGRNSDNGAVGKSKEGVEFDEVDICIKVAQEQLKSDIANGVNVYFTCEDHDGKAIFNNSYTSNSLYPTTRANIANQIISKNPGSDFTFISLHANSGFTNGVSGTGVEVVHSNFPGSKELAERVAKNAGENGTIALRSGDNQKKDTENTGVKSLASVPRATGVLSSVNCPAILYEAGFLSSKDDIAKMRQKNFAAQVAENINTPFYEDIKSGKVFAGFERLKNDPDYRAEFLARIDSGAASKKDIVRFQTIMGIEADGDFGITSDYGRRQVSLNGDVFTESAKESAIYFQNNPSARDTALAQLAYDMELKEQLETQLAINQPSDLAREALANVARGMTRPPFPDYTIDSNEENSLAFVDIGEMDFGGEWVETEPLANQREMIAGNLTANGTFRIPVSATGVDFAEILQNFQTQVNAHEIAPVEPSNKNPFYIDKTIGEAKTPPAPPQPQMAAQAAPAEVDTKTKIAEMFAQFNGEKGNVAMVYQRSTTLCAQDRAAATLVQQSLNLIGIAEIPDNELGHVAGGKTKQEVMEFQKLDGLKVDGIVGANTYTKLEEKVLKAIDGNPAKAQEFVLALQKSQERYLAELVTESKDIIAQNSATSLPTPQNQAGQGVVPS